jgi:hypothetical protein
VANNLQISPSNPLTTETLVGSYVYSDADDDPENGTEIRWYKNSILQPQLNNTLTVSSALTTKGEVWYFTVKPKDGTDFGTLETSPSVTIQNSPPQIISFTPTNTTPEVDEEESLQFTQISSDQDNETLTYSWLLDTVQKATTQNWTYSPSHCDVGVRNLTVVVSDGALQASQEWRVTVNMVPTHDVAIIEILPAISGRITVWEGLDFNINVTVQNHGSFRETFNVTVYANETMISTRTNITLTSGNSATITFTWNTTGVAKGNYTLTAAADIVPGETDTADNNCTGSWILVTKIGDLGGGVPPHFFQCDDKVDGKDLALFLQCYRGTAPSETMYLADLGGGVPPRFFEFDGKCDGKDLALFLLCYKGSGPDT